MLVCHLLYSSPKGLLFLSVTIRFALLQKAKTLKNLLNQKNILYQDKQL